MHIPNRFRDTFAVELLLSGVPIERVSILLGHSSVRITEKHYAPWVRDRQVQLEADVRRHLVDRFHAGSCAAIRNEEYTGGTRENCSP